MNYSLRGKHVTVAGAGAIGSAVGLDLMNLGASVEFIESPNASDEVTEPLALFEIQGCDEVAEGKTLEWMSYRCMEGQPWVDMQRVTYFRADSMELADFAPEWAAPEHVPSEQIPEKIREDCPYGLSFDAPILNWQMYKRWLRHQVVSHVNYRGIRQELITDRVEQLSQYENVVVAIGGGLRHTGEQVDLLGGLPVTLACENFPQHTTMGWKIPDEHGGQSCNGVWQPGTDGHVKFGATRVPLDEPREPKQDEINAMRADIQARLPWLKIRGFVSADMCPRPGGPKGFHVERHSGKKHKRIEFLTPGGSGLTLAHGLGFYAAHFLLRS